jgi:GMP synthase (glutamine-hydrolysing)
VEQSIREIREQVGEKRVLLALSGGVDSSTLAFLLHKAIGDQLTCMFIDQGFMRKYEPERLVNYLKSNSTLTLSMLMLANAF